MSSRDPSLLLAAGIALDIFHDAIPRRLLEREVAAYSVEWLAWATLVAVSWTRAIVDRSAVSPAVSARLEDSSVLEQPLERKISPSLPLILSFCLLGMGYLSQWDNGIKNWTMVSHEQ